MRTIVKLLFLLVLPACLQAQTTADADSLKHLLLNEKQDTARVNLLLQLSSAYSYSRPDTALLLGQQALLLARNANFAAGEIRGLNAIAQAFRHMGNFPKALALELEGLKKAEATNDKMTITTSLIQISNTYSDAGDERQSINYALKALALAQSTGHQRRILTNLLNLGDSYEKLNQLDSAKFYTEQAYQMAVHQKVVASTGITLNNLGNIYSKLGRYSTALIYYRWGMPFLIKAERGEVLCETYLGIAKIFQKMGRADSSLYYAKQALTTAKQAGFMRSVLAASNFLTSYYSARHELDSAFLYQSATITVKDSLFSQEKQRQMQKLSYEETVRNQQLQQARAEARTQMKINALIGVLFTLCIAAFLLWRNNRQKQKANVEITKAYQQLKATQAQLIQSEKMASLGELTAGIAHEIQNPLNFVNNFSETNSELLQEAKTEFKLGNNEEGIAILDDIGENEQKINHHGRRAEAIVKSMLEHSRSSKGEKQATDINALCEEYLRLCYHGLRAKDKTFNAVIETHFDESIGKVNIVPQDLGRVLLNLFNNAFYAVSEKKKKVGDDYEPTVTVTSKRLSKKFEIVVKDNGTGIPQAVMEKIFQPFFTTKPTGQGLGLGLSLSYDIVKAHGGELRVDSKEGEGALFTIELPA
jgi:signal transduction histidine kinase